MGDAFVNHQLVENGRFIGHAENKLHARAGPSKGQAPACSMKHRHDGQQHRRCRQFKHARRNFGHRVEHGRTVLVKDALRIASRAAGVAEHTRIALVTVMPFVIAVLFADKGRITFRIVEYDVSLHGCQMRLKPVNNRLEHSIIEQHLIFGMIHDVDQVFIEEPRVDGVDHAAKADRAIPGGQMPVMVHGQRRHPVSRFQPHRRKTLRQPPGIVRNTRPAGALQRAIGPARNDLASAAFARGVVDQVRDPQ